MRHAADAPRIPSILAYTLTPQLHTTPHYFLSRPATLTSFVVVNFTNDQRSCKDFVETVMTVAKGHGIEMRGMTDEVIRNHLDKVTVHYAGRDAVDDVRHNI